MSRTSKAIDIFQPVGNPAELILPDASRIFLDRSRRFASLAEGHSLSGWLSFLGRLTRLQHGLLQDYPPVAMAAASSGIPSPEWREGLTALAGVLTAHAPGPARETLQQIQAMNTETLDRLAVRVLRGELDGPEARYLPFIAAALQLHWTAATSRLKGAVPTNSADPRRCPCCGYAPVAGIVRTDGAVPKLRYLHCALCNTEWHLVRVTCAGCGDSGRIGYFHIEGSDEAARAETCDACGSYLKMIDREKSPEADPVADDLATLALDLLVQEAGYGRLGANLLFMPAAANEK